MKKTGKIVLLDHGESADWLTNTLLRNSFEPVLFDSAIKCFRYFECGDTADLIIVNLYLPVISGWQFARMIRSPEFSHLNSLPLIAISSILEDSHAGLLRTSHNIDAFFAIPCDESSFLSKIHEYIRNGRPSPNHLKLLVIDDDEAMCEMIKTALKRHDYEVNNALNADQGRKAAESTLPDLILLDHHLPDVIGIDIFPKLKAAGDPTIIIITADPDPDLSVQYAALGADAYIRKPFAVENLLNIISRAQVEKAMLAVESILAKRTNALMETNKRYKAIKILDEEMRKRRAAEEALLEITAREKEKLGRDLHDQLGQQLTGIAFMAKNLETLIKPLSTAGAEDATLLTKLANEAVERIRDTARGLAMPKIAKEELPTLLHDTAQATSRIYGIKCDVNCNADTTCMNDDIPQHIYRIAHEALQNAAKHSGADAISIKLSSIDESFKLVISDNGHGFLLNNEKSGVGMGIHLMKMRARLLGAELQISSSKKSGTKITCVVNCRAKSP